MKDKNSQTNSKIENFQVLFFLVRPSRCCCCCKEFERVISLALCQNFK